MATNNPNTKKSNTQILQELEALSQSLYQSHAITTTTKTTQRTASLSLPRTSVPPITNENIGPDKDELILNPKPRSRRMSLSPWRARPKPQLEVHIQHKEQQQPPDKSNKKWADENPSSEKKGIWNWKPIRALAHMTKQKLSCLFAVEVVSIQGLPASMTGLRLSVCVRKKESKDGAIQTMPSRVSDGAADFEERLFMRCNVYFTPGNGTHLKFEPRPFLISVVAVDAEELDFGRSSVDLSGLIQESIEKSFEGTRVKQWDTCFSLHGKAKGGELVLKLGFQIMEKDGGIGIYSQAEGQKSKNRGYHSLSFARRQSKTSFSILSSRITGRAEEWTVQQKGAAASDDDHLKGIDDLNLNEQALKPDEPNQDDDIPDFDVVDKGVEIQEKDMEKEEQQQEEQLSEEDSDKISASSEVVKEVVQDQSHLIRLSELDSIAQQIKALESIMGDKQAIDEETASQILDADEDKVTREFLQMLELVKEDKLKNITTKDDKNRNPLVKNDEASEVVFLPDLGKGLGPVVQTRNGGYLASMNPLETSVSRSDSPKLAMQMSKPLIIRSNENGIEVFQKMAAMGLQEMTSEIQSLMPLDELMGKTAEQIAFEGIASAIIQGRNREGSASSTTARTIAAVKSMVTAMNNGRKERFSTGIWNVNEDPLTVDEILAFSLQKIESMALEALAIQADVSEEHAPFNVSPINQDAKNANLLASAVPIEDWIKESITKGLENEELDSENVTLAVAVQLRDPRRQFEAVGGPMIALIHATGKLYDEEKRYKVVSLQVGGVKVGSTCELKNVWDGQKQKLTALQWLVGLGMGKGGRKGKRVGVKGPDLLWSISSRILADMWLKPIRTPDVKFTQ